ncbi:MAG: hypothetical protein A2075_10690 [Geobacteraceae bacterium GWC2_58_44]|nr:MAG: hypothetical protein A2075_10690 [Geobacteraceae bacterium GWC2_58_44]
MKGREFFQRKISANLVELRRRLPVSPLCQGGGFQLAHHWLKMGTILNLTAVGRGEGGELLQLAQD